VSREPEAMRLAFHPLKRLYGETAAADFGPLKPSARRHMIDQNLLRSLINRRIRYIERMFERAVSQEMGYPRIWASQSRLANGSDLKSIRCLPKHQFFG